MRLHVPILPVLFASGLGACGFALDGYTGGPKAGGDDLGRTATMTTGNVWVALGAAFAGQ